MAFQIHRENEELQVVTILPGQEASEQKSFDRALEEALKWLRSQWGWNGNSPAPPDASRGDVNGPTPGHRWKLYGDTQISGEYHVTFQWDYTFGSPLQHDTNRMTWRVVEI